MNISKEFSPTWGNYKTTPMRIFPFPATRPSFFRARGRRIRVCGGCMYVCVCMRARVATAYHAAGSLARRRS